MSQLFGRASAQSVDFIGIRTSEGSMLMGGAPTASSTTEIAQQLAKESATLFGFQVYGDGSVSGIRPLYVDWIARAR